VHNNNIIHIVQYSSGRCDITNLPPPGLCSGTRNKPFWIRNRFNDTYIYNLISNRHGQEGITSLFCRSVDRRRCSVISALTDQEDFTTREDFTPITIILLHTHTHTHCYNARLPITILLLRTFSSLEKK